MKNRTLTAAVRRELAAAKSQPVTRKETSEATYWLITLSIAGVIAAVAVITGIIY